MTTQAAAPTPNSPEKKQCDSCLGKSGVNYSCGACAHSLCKSCVHFLPEDSFHFESSRPKSVAHTSYCHSCYTSIVVPELEQYEATLESARNVMVYDRLQGKESRLLKRTEKPLRVENCSDMQDGLMKLAFAAAKSGFNCLVDVDLKSTKVRDGAYQTKIWAGTGVPTNAQANRVVKDRSLWQNPN